MINIENLKRARDYIDKHVPEDMIDMSSYREEERQVNPVCGSVGCIIGHTTALDIKNVQENYINRWGDINFESWSADFYSASPEVNMCLWDFLFGSCWHGKETKDKERALERMDYVIINGREPKDWDYEWTKG